MLVDDLADMRRLVELWLEESDVSVVGQAADCAEALAIIERHAPDVAVVDLSLPGGDGAGCVAELRRRRPEVAVVAFVSAEDPAVEQAMRAAGAIAHFHKSDLPALVRYLGSAELADALRPG